MPAQFPSLALSRMLMRFQPDRGTHRGTAHDRQTGTRCQVCPIGRTRQGPARCNAPPEQPVEGHSAIRTTMLGSRAEKAQLELRDLPLPGRPLWNPEHLSAVVKHQRGRSFQLLEYE